MAEQVYKVRDPSGAMREIRGPAGATDEQVIAQAKLLLGAKEEQPSQPRLLPDGRPSLAHLIPGQDFVPTEQMIAPKEQPTNNSYINAALAGAAAVPVIGSAARGAQLLSRGTRFAPQLSRVANFVIPKTTTAYGLEMGAGAVSGMSAKAAADAAPAGYEELAGMFGGAIGGGVASGIGVKAITGLPAMFSGKKDLTNQISDLLGKQSASRHSIEALSSNPNLATEIGRAGEIKDLTGINLPMLAAANGDTTISSYLQQQVGTGGNAKFTATVKLQYEQAERELLQAKRGSAPSMMEVDAYVKKKALATIKANEGSVKAAEVKSQKRARGVDKIDERIGELSRGVSDSTGKTDIGARLTNLVEAKASSIRAELSPQYSTLITDSSAAGIKLPGESAKNLRDYATDKTNEDVFSSFPKLYADIKRIFKPEVDVKPRVTYGNGSLVDDVNLPKAEGKFRDYSLADIDSLKRNVNEALRKSKDAGQTRRLLELKKEVTAAIDTIDPSFVTPYRELDSQYATRLGIPFTQAGVTKIDRARFVEDTVPVLTSRSSSLKQALGVIGDSKDGLKIIDDAFMYDISSKRGIVSVDGVVNHVQLTRYIKERKEQLDLVPETKAKLEQLSGRVGELMKNRTRILEAEKSAKVDKLETIYTEAYGSKEGIRGVVRRALSNQEDLDKLLAISANDKVAREGLKSAVLDDLTALPGNRVELLEKNRDAITKIFGEDHMKSLDAIVEASQRLKDNPMVGKVNINTISKTSFETLSGTKLSTSVGEARNQVLSMPRVFINHISRFFEGKSSKSEAVEIQKFLLDTNALKETAALYKELNLRGFSDRAMALMENVGVKFRHSMLFGVGIGGVVGTQVDEKQESKIDKELLEGFEGEQQ